MTYKVIQWATGTVGIHAVPAIVAHPDARAGRAVGALRQQGRPGRRRALRRRAGRASSPPRTPTRCSPSTPTASATRPTPTSAPARWSRTSAACWPSGKNVVNTSFVPLLFPKAAGDGRATTSSQAACLEGGTSFFTSGIDPGFGNAGITVHALALCKEVRTRPDDGDRQLRHVGQPLHDVRDHGVREAGHVAVAAARRPGRPRWRGARCSSWWPRPSGSQLDADRGAPRGAAGRQGRRRSRRARWPRGPSRACASRSSAWSAARSGSWSSTSPACATRTPRTGPRARATGSSSRASRT